MKLYKKLVDDIIENSSGIIYLRDIIEFIEEKYFGIDNPQNQPKDIKKTVSAYVCKKIKSDFSYEIVQNNPFSFIKSIDKIKIDYQEKISEMKNKEILHERDLHKSAEMFFNLKNISSRTIFHEISNKNADQDMKWLHPDMVGISYNTLNFDKAPSLPLLSFMSKASIPIFDLYSFELKRDLNSNNFKKCFFQAVSNSSWANYGYLVVESIDIYSDVFSELQRLNKEFRIGLIKLDPLNHFNSKILIPSIKRNNLDLNLIDILIRNNNDFKDFIISTDKF